MLGGANQYPFHQIIDFETILAKGFRGIQADAMRKADEFRLDGNASGQG